MLERRGFVHCNKAVTGHRTPKKPMNRFKTLLRVASFVILFLSLALTTSAQGEAQGGRIPTKPTTPKETTTPAKTTTPTKTATPKRAPAALDRIDGKWWTTGNGFGPSEVILTQNGSNISGVIRWSDGRNGVINGTLSGKRLQHTWSDSSGNGGSGWLELSWANFLGGPWHNQRVKDGSWTLNRIEGKWCFGGSKTRIRTVTHDAQGTLRIVTEDGGGLAGHLEGPWIFLDDEGQSIKGDMFYKANRIDFANGAYWTWCGR